MELFIKSGTVGRDAEKCEQLEEKRRSDEASGLITQDQVALFN